MTNPTNTSRAVALRRGTPAHAEALARQHPEHAEFLLELADLRRAQREIRASRATRLDQLLALIERRTAP